MAICGDDWRFNMVRRCRSVSILVLAFFAMFILMLYYLLSISPLPPQTVDANPLPSTSLPSELREENKNVEYNYGVVIDAGSSGSRLFVYVWPRHSGDSKDLIKIKPLNDEIGKPVVKKISPGLSSFGPYPDNATNHVFELLDFAGEHIPTEKHKETSLFILATAGLRLIPESQSAAILKVLREEVPKRYQFIVLDSHIDIISGKWEGIYSWIAVNYALGRFDLASASTTNPDAVVVYDEVSNSTIRRQPTVGMLDMGGGSLQIAFETFDKVPRMQEHLTQEVNLGSDEDDLLHKYRLYVTTFLGFGANVAIDRYEQILFDRIKAEKKEVALDPCMPVNLIKTVQLDNGKKNESEKLTFTRKGVGDFDKCMENLIPLLNLHKTCPEYSCSFDGVFQPSVNLSKLELFGFSEFWYTTDDILRVSGEYNFDKFKQAASEFCGSKWSTLKRRHENKIYPKADFARLRTQCVKSGWVGAVLHEGFKIPRNGSNKFKSVSSIDGQEVQWTLGALLYMLRHFPLRELQRIRELQLPSPHRRLNQTVSLSYLGSDSTFYLLICVCIFVVVLSSCRYCVNLKHLPSSTTRIGNPMIRRNKSLMGYMMVDDDDDDKTLLTNIRVESSNYVY